MNTPDYKRIYTDMIRIKYPEKHAQCSDILKKDDLEFLDIIRMNTIITDRNKERMGDNQKLRSYNKITILKILYHQQKHGMNNSELARHFQLSRNTVTKWKKHFSQASCLQKTETGSTLNF
ncbi:helix-turn-helix domain-containing protein [uncultured Chryseobacterium sp.]|uniref:helix-turn-helix domain-containing protein n=1 Tax=uncultured Chryseobacterium sp. TaxID=259322 RepID=UPI0034511F0F